MISHVSILNKNRRRASSSCCERQRITRIKRAQEKEGKRMKIVIEVKSMYRERERKRKKGR